jgi:carbamoyltransferase
MLLVAEVKESKKIRMSDDEKKIFGIKKLNIPKSLIPAVTHVDYSSRIQTVDKNINAKFYNLIHSFKKLTGFPILVNTSFNIRGEPIVCNPEDAYKCFMSSEIDILVIENFYFDKKLQNKKFLKNYKSSYKLD